MLLQGEHLQHDLCMLCTGSMPCSDNVLYMHGSTCQHDACMLGGGSMLRVLGSTCNVVACNALQWRHAVCARQYLQLCV